MSLESATDAFRARAMDLAGLNYVVKFDLGDEGVVMVDGKAMPPVISNEPAEADCTISLSMENLEKLVAGQLNPSLAFTMGKLKVDGSTGVALKLSSMLDD